MEKMMNEKKTDFIKTSLKKKIKTKNKQNKKNDLKYYWLVISCAVVKKHQLFS